MTEADELRKALDFMRIWLTEDAHLGESEISRELEKAEGLRKLDAIEQAIAATLGEVIEGCYLMRDGKKFPVELDYGFLGILPISIKVAGFRYLLEVPNGE